MADIDLTLGGDSAGAVKALNETGEATGNLSKASAKAWKEIGDYAKTAGTVVAAFGVASVKAFMEADRVQKQLVRAAGEHAEALGEQADAMERLFAVDGEVIKQSQTLLTQWGGVGAASEEVTRAVLDYAAATGQDAVQATQDLIRNVESGGTGLAKLGIHFDATGNKGEDLSRAVDALGKKFGGAAGADAASLHGQVSAVGLAFERLQEDIGESIASMSQQAGVASKLIEILGALDEFAFWKQGDAHEKASTRAAAWVQAQKELTNAQQEMSMLATSGNASPTLLAMFLQDVERAQAKVDALKASAAPLLPGLDTVSGDTNKEMKDGDARIKAAQAHAEKMETLRAKNIEDFRKFQKDWDEVDLHATEQQEKIHGDMLKRIEEHSFATWDAIDDASKKSAEKLGDAMAKVAETQREELKKQEKLWADAGTAIGAAFATSLGRELERLMEGGDLDAGEVVANIIGDVLAVAGQVIGTAVGAAYGGPAGGQLGGAIGGAVGGLAGTGVKALGKAGRQKKYHSGGPIGDEPERYHSGGPLGSDEMPIIAQKGENMWSRADVAGAGGQRAVEQMKGGGPKFSFTINTIDALGTRQFFENDGGRGFFNALRTGRGSLLPAFGGG